MAKAASGPVWDNNVLFNGMNSLRRAISLPKGQCAYSLNGDLGSSSQAAPLPGYSEYGHQANPNDIIVRKFTYTTSDGVEIQLQVRDNLTNYIVEYLNTFDVRNSVQGEWTLLDTGMSRSVVLSNGTTQKAPFGFAPFNDTNVNQLVYGNGIDFVRVWNAANASIASSTATTITISGTATIAQRMFFPAATVSSVTGTTITIAGAGTVASAGFATSGSVWVNGTTSVTYTGISGNQFTGTGSTAGIVAGQTIQQYSGGIVLNTSLVIGGVTYTYTGVDAKTFSGVSADPTGNATGTGLAQLYDTTTIPHTGNNGGIFLSDFGRVFMAGIPQTPTQVNYSDVADLTSWSGSTPSDGGFEDFPELNGPITMLSSIGTYVIVGSANKILGFTFQQPSSTTQITVKQSIADEGCPGPKAYRKFGDQLVYLTKSGGLKVVSQIAATNVFNIDDWTEEIRPTLENFVWDSDSCLEYSTKKRVFFAAGKSNSNISMNDSGFHTFLSLDEKGKQQRNSGFHDWFIGDMCIYKGDIHFGSSLASRSFLAYSGYSKNGAPYNWVRTERVELFSDAWDRKWAVYFGIRGAINTGTTGTWNLLYESNGSLTSQPMQIIGTDDRWVSPQSLRTLGRFALGTEPLGGTVGGLGDLSAFEVIYELPNGAFARDYQLTLETSGSGQSLVVDMYAFAVQSAGQLITANEISELGATNVF